MSMGLELRWKPPGLKEKEKITIKSNGSNFVTTDNRSWCWFIAE